MRLYFYFIMMASVLLSCNSSKKYLTSDKGCNFDQTISEDEFTINTNYFDSIITLQKEYEGFLGATFYEDIEFKKAIKHIPGKPLLYSISTFYKKQNIKKRILYDSLGRIYNSEFSYMVYKKKYSTRFLTIGKENYYDPLTSEIKNTIDHRDADHYKICYKEALAIVKGLKPTKHYISAMSRRTMESDADETKRYVWRVFVDEPKDSKTHPKTFIYVIDATTGEFVKKMHVVFGP